MAADAQARAQPGELAGAWAGRGQRIGRLQGGDDVTEVGRGMRDQSGLGVSQFLGGVLREGRRHGEEPGGEGEIEVVPDLVYGANVDRADGGQHLRG